MQTNIFRDAYFGKPYRTRDDRKAIYGGTNKESRLHNLMFQTKDGDVCLALYNADGTYSMSNKAPWLDITGERHEEINEEELAENAKKYAEEAPMTGVIPDGYNTPCFDECDIADAYEAGYRKALEQFND